MTRDNIVLIVAVVVGLLLIWLAFRLIVHAFAVALRLFAWAAEQGFIGVAAYVACWVFMFPVMVVICLVGAVFSWIGDREIAYDGPAAILPPNVPRDEAERQLWAEQDRRFEEAKARLAAQQRQADEES